MSALPMSAIVSVNLPNAAALAQEAAGYVAERINAAIALRGHAVVGLSGGSTPGPAYRLLGQRTDISWSAVTFFLVDERLVPAHNSESNLHLLRETLCAGPASNATFIVPDTSLPITECIRKYDDALARLTRIHPIDLLIMGLGQDGHIASLFPPLSAAASGPKLVLATETEDFAVRQRISTTLAFLLSAKELLFLLAGDAKRETWEQMLNDASGPKRWPAKAMLQHHPARVLFCP